MTRIEHERQMITWRLEDAQRDLAEGITKMKNLMDSSERDIYEWSMHYAEKIKKAGDDVKKYTEMLNMLDHIEG